MLCVWRPPGLDQWPPNAYGRTHTGRQCVGNESRASAPLQHTRARPAPCCRQAPQPRTRQWAPCNINCPRVISLLSARARAARAPAPARGAQDTHQCPAAAWSCAAWPTCSRGFSRQCRSGTAPAARSRREALRSRELARGARAGRALWMHRDARGAAPSADAGRRPWPSRRRAPCPC